jgi:hypothetical protein
MRRDERRRAGRVQRVGEWARLSCCANGTPARFHGQRGGRRRRRRTPTTVWASGRERGSLWRKRARVGEEKRGARRPIYRGRRGRERGSRGRKWWPVFMAAMNGVHGA